MDTIDSTTPLKRCYRCGRMFPATGDYFHSRKTAKDGLNRECKECNRAKSREWYHSNQERGKATRRAWAEANREANSNYKREWKKANRERLSQKAKEWYAENKETIRIRRKRWYDANTEHARAYALEWQKNNPDRAKANQGKHRARKQSADGTYTARDLAAIRAAQTDKQGRLICWRCGKPIYDTPDLDHWIPLDKQGANHAGNLHYMHATCNRSKGAKHPTEIGRLL